MPLTQHSLSLDRLTPLPHGKARLGGELGRRIDLTILANLLKLNLEQDFLSHFETRDSTAPGDYVGMGKLLDAAVRLAALGRSPEATKLKDLLVSRLLDTQEPDGYIGVFKPEHRGWKLWDIHEMAYLLVGLNANFELFGHRSSHEAAQRLATYIMGRFGPSLLEAFTRQGITLENATIGLEAGFLGLYRATGDETYLNFLIKETGFDTWDWPILMNIKGHAYTYMARCLAQLELYRLNGNPQLLAESHKVIDFVLNRDGLVITGGVSQGERWHDNHFGMHALAETCAVAYLLWLLDSLLRLEGNPLYGDVMERIIFNSLFAAQSPDGRKLRYFTPFEGERHYFNKDTYCCPGNFRRVMGDLSNMAYYTDETGVVVNLYTESQAEVELRDGTIVRLAQLTRYPSSGHIRLAVEPIHDAAFSLKLRIPRWTSSATLSLNGDPVRTAEPGSLYSIDRTWSPGDAVEIRFEMEPRLLRGRQMKARHTAVTYGPLIFGLNTTRQNMYLEPDLPFLRLDTGSITGPEEDHQTRPGGLCFHARAWSKKSMVLGQPDLEIELTEFIDPGVRSIYFLTADLLDEAIGDDELYGAWEAPSPS